MTTIAGYQVFFTPLDKLNVYGDSVDVTDFVLETNLGKIKQQIDSGNFDIGLYTFADMRLTMANYDGRFNDENDSSSMFYFLRDRAKVEIKYTDNDNVTTTIYIGIINDEATDLDLEKETVKLRILSRDSIFAKTKVAGGLINDTDTASTAIKALLNRPAITSVLGYDANKINVGYDAPIDNATPFSNKNTKTALFQLLNCSGSVFFVDDSGDMVVKDRDVLAGSSLNLFGGGDRFQRDNIIQIKKYNNGTQRAFNTFTINNNTATDDNYVDRFGLIKKTFSFDFITNTTTHGSIGEYYVGEFKEPRRELEVVVKTNIAKDINILSPVSIDYSKRYKGYRSNKVPVAGAAIAGSDVAPYIIGGSQISPSIKWKVTGILHDLKKMETTIRLRQI